MSSQMRWWSLSSAVTEESPRGMVMLRKWKVSLPTSPSHSQILSWHLCHCLSQQWWQAQNTADRKEQRKLKFSLVHGKARGCGHQLLSWEVMPLVTVVGWVSSRRRMWSRSHPALLAAVAATFHVFIREVQKKPEQHGSPSTPRRCRSSSLCGWKDNLCCFWSTGSSADMMAFQTRLTVEQMLGFSSGPCETHPFPNQHPHCQASPKYSWWSWRSACWFCWVQWSWDPCVLTPSLQAEMPEACCWIFHLPVKYKCPIHQAVRTASTHWKLQKTMKKQSCAPTTPISEPPAWHTQLWLLLCTERLRNPLVSAWRWSGH